MVSPSGWVNVERMSLSNDEAGRPVVIMMGCVQDARNSRVVGRTWTGTEWTEPDEIDRFDGSGVFGGMISYLDSKGRIHVAYDRDLDDRESYGFMDGQFPDKCFHAVRTEQGWSKASATTGRGKFYVDPVSLGEFADGTVYLTVEVHPFTSSSRLETEYLGCQRWSGREWSELEEGTPKALSTDYWGNRISELRATTQRSDGVGKGPARPRTASCRDRLGRLVVFSWDSSQVTVCMWNGNEWAEDVTFSPGFDVEKAHVLFNPDGNVYWLGDARGRIVIQRIRLLPRGE